VRLVVELAIEQSGGDAVLWDTKLCLWVSGYWRCEETFAFVFKGPAVNKTKRTKNTA